MKPLCVLLALSALAAPAMGADTARRDRDIEAGEAQLAKLTKGLVAGKPTSCLPFTRSTDSSKIEGVGILYGFGRQRWLNRLNDSCGRFRQSDILVIESRGQACRGDMVRVYDSGSRIPVGSCVLGDFIPYTRAR
ncbi:hypothetical protein [Sphingomonas bacterium]|uniref:hypothetical protein n=1 Tax=Sphingomonas bacterium TaxID=1895847 RepID=UPI0015773792|nr:hypothetical protein [Sphingomonas bacterium]